MQKRTVKFGEYNTADYGWTLTGWDLSAPEQKTTYVEKTGGDGSWDLSTVLTGGLPRYKTRKLTATFECSVGNREHREALINDMVNLLDGLEWPIVPPDRPDHYLVGRVHVAVNQNSLSWAMVTVTAVVSPWLYSARETIHDLSTSSSDVKSVQLINGGRRALVPTITVAQGSSIVLQFGNITTTLKNGATLVIYETVISEGMAWGRCDAGWVYLYYVDLTPTTGGAVDARVVYNDNTIIYSDMGMSQATGSTYAKMAVVDIYEIVGKMARTELGWINTDNLL
jgi:hypothetical protein